MERTVSNEEGKVVLALLPYEGLFPAGALNRVIDIWRTLGEAHARIGTHSIDISKTGKVLVSNLPF
jgi:hypothetical protein